ncbi:MAG: helix-turn-helix domain-containing protein [Clostridia bacterium]|nr:helix-turn-helix domain-containing protein [Clostridia bacterium]
MRINATIPVPSKSSATKRNKNAPLAYLADLHCDMGYALDNPPQEKNFFHHSHLNYEMLYFVRGDAEYNIEGRIFPLKPHDLIFIQPKQFHCLHLLSLAPYERYVSNFDAHVLPCENRERLDNLPSIVNIEENIFIRTCFEKLRSYANRFSEADTRLMIRCAVREILLNLIYEAPTIRRDCAQRNHIIDRIIALTNKYPEKDWNAETLSRELYLSKSYIQNVFSQHMEIGLKNYINTKKILYAQSLLLSGESPAFVCEACGFHDYSTFYRLFRKITGTTPTAITKGL